MRVSASLDQRDIIGKQIRDYIESEFPELAKDREEFVERGKKVLEEETKKTYFVTAQQTTAMPVEARSFKVVSPNVKQRRLKGRR